MVFSPRVLYPSNSHEGTHTHIHTQIQEALKNDLQRFPFEGREIRLDARTGIFITMNPGYAGG